MRFGLWFAIFTSTIIQACLRDAAEAQRIVPHNKILHNLWTYFMEIIQKHNVK